MRRRSKDEATQTLDFFRSFLTFEVDFQNKPNKAVTDLQQNLHNRARIQIACRCEITEMRSGRATEYFLGENCKTERVGASRELGIFTQPNADFRPIMSHADTLVLKSWDKNDKGVMLVPASLGLQPDRQLLKNETAFVRHYFHLRQTEGTILKDTQEIIAAADRGQPLFARTEYTQADHRIVLDYPIWTINVSERHQSYQTDTGPILHADFSKPYDSLIERFWLAFSAFNSPNWIEMIVQKPTLLGHGISVNHYEESVWIDHCKNSVIAVG